MSKVEYICLTKIAELLGVNAIMLKNVRTYLDGFPKAKQQGKHKIYSLPAVQAWASGKDIPALLSAANKQRVERCRAIASGKIQERPFNNHEASRFISGAYLPATQKQQIEYKKLVARTTQPKTKTVHLVFDWMLEDGRNAKYRSTAC